MSGLTSGKVFRLRKNEPQGRLTLLRCVNLIFTPDTSFGKALFDIDSTLIDELRAWTREFFNNSRLSDPRFPALQNLTLDFLAMRFDENEGFRVDPFVRRLAPCGGLRKLVVKGIKHADTLKGLRAGLVKDEGIFVVENPSV